ncbi:MAG: hypothetical protein GSR72_01445 [Desulfurococcales archaeon]|nr:hypothetical protein [Desulfurococcales archaeon]
MVFQAAENENGGDAYDLLLFGVSSGGGVSGSLSYVVPVLLLAGDCPGLGTYPVDVSEVCGNGCGISAVVGDTGSLEGFAAPGGYDKVSSNSNVLLVKAGDRYYLALKPKAIEENKAVTVVLRHPTPQGIASTPVRITLAPNAVTPGLLHDALAEALKESSPQSAQNKFEESLLKALTNGYNSRVHPVIVPPTASDREARELVRSALLSCGGGNAIPVEILDRYNTLGDTLRLLVTEFDLGQVGSGSFALCLGDEKTREALGLENTCYGKYIDEELMRELFNPGALASYSAACSAATLACGFLMQDWKALLADVVAVCGLPAAWVAFHPPGDLVERLRSGGDVGLVYAGGIGGEVLGGGVLGAGGVAALRAARPYTVKQLTEFYYRARAVEGSGLLGRLRVPGVVTYDTGAVVEEIARALKMVTENGQVPRGAKDAVRAVLNSAPTATRAEARLAVLKKIYDSVPDGYRSDYLSFVKDGGDPLQAFQKFITESQELSDNLKSRIVSRVSRSLFGERGETPKVRRGWGQATV